MPDYDPSHIPPMVPPATSRPAQAPSAPRSRAWMWWTFGILAAIALIVLSCSLPFVALFGSSDAGAGGFGEAVAVIRIDGAIAGTGDVYGGYVTPENFLATFKKAEGDADVKAILLRVDSPGGTVAASEEIAEYVRRATKPVVVSVGDIGASGAYMISSQADEIWAMPGSSVGSIGVISEIPNASRLMDKLGLEFQVITAGKNKDTGSMYRSLTKEERALIQGGVDEAYEQFIKIVAEGRDMPSDQVRKLATGWVWNGDKAKSLGLIDKIGTYQDALDAAAKRGGIKGKYDVRTYDEQAGGLLGSLLGLSQSLQRLAPASSSSATAARQAVPR